MSKCMFSASEAQRLSVEDLAGALELYHGAACGAARANFRTVARWIKRGQLSWTEVELAIDAGWDPVREDATEAFGPRRVRGHG